jgi:hypothetical protein
MSEKLLTVKFESEIQILSIKKLLSATCGGGRVRPRGRHSNRKAVLGNGYRPGTQNDIPWRMAETVTFYKLNK